jgi:hypothetical protein
LIWQAIFSNSAYAMIDILEKTSVRELQKGLHTATEYVSIMERAQEYAECVAESLMAAAKKSDALKKSQSQLIAMMVCLFISSWESLGRYQAAVYKQAYKNVRRSREQTGDRLMVFSSVDTERAFCLQHQVNMAEQCCASQKGLILAEYWGHRVIRATPPATVATPTATATATATIATATRRSSVS